MCFNDRRFKKEVSSLIIQTGMRTDIPAFYSKWFASRVREGFVYVRNPYDPVSVTRYSLSPEVVDLLGFCTKNPAPMFPYMDLLKPYGQYWFVTITPYGRDMEPNVPDKEIVIEDFKRLSSIVGIDSVGWRYDPIFITEKYSVERHIAEFEQMAAKLAGYTKTCVISFIDLYQKVRRNFPEVHRVGQKERIQIGKTLIGIAGRYGMTVKPCAEGEELAPYGADCSGCMTLETYEKALHCHLDAPKKKPLRKECACYLASDIGQYDTCGHFCRYCYANTEVETVKRNMRQHDPASPFLVGNLRPEDKVHEAVQSSWMDGHMRFDF